MTKLSKRTIDALKPQDGDYFVWDEELKNFGVRVLPSGQKTFLVQYRNGGRTRRVKLGRYGALTADEGRKEAQRVLGEVAKGENPAEAISTYRRASSMAKVCERFYTDHALQRCKPSTQREYRRCIDIFINPKLGAHKITDITRADISELHHGLRDKPYQANRVLQVLSKLFNLAEVWGLRPDGSNPCRHVPKYRENKRERFLSPAEIQRLFGVLDEAERDGSESHHACAAYRLLMLTGCRLSEIQTLKWDYIDGDYIRLPDSKTGARKIPIDQTIHDALKRIKQLPDNPYVIAGKVEKQHLTDLQHPWQRIRIRANLEGVRIHDLRHTYASKALMSGLPIEMVGKLLGHTQIQTTMRYAHLADEPVRMAAAQVASGIGALMDTPAATQAKIAVSSNDPNVIPFRQRPKSA
jgi:integrase